MESLTTKDIFMRSNMMSGQSEIERICINLRKLLVRVYKEEVDMKLKSPKVDYSDFKFQVGLKIPGKHCGHHVSKLLITFQFEVFQTQVTGMVKQILKLL